MTFAPVSTLRITEIFYSLQGESQTVGLPTIFIRLTGCPLRCQYCDTEYAFTGGEEHSFEEIFKQIKAYNTPYITVTGGEPLAQKNCIPLLKQLCDEGYSVSLETSGALSIQDIDPRVNIVMDIKTPASDEADKNLWANLDYLKDSDEIKFVICNREDYDWMKTIAETHDLYSRFQILVSPAFEEIETSDLAEWILEDQLVVRMQVQLHKLIWGDEQGR